MLNKRQDQGLAEAGELPLTLHKNLGYRFPEGCWRPGYRDAALAQKTSCLVDNRRSLLDQKFAHAVRCLHVLLFNRLHGNKVHGRPGCGLDDSLGVVAIILVRFNEGRNVVGADEAHLDPCLLETPRPVVGRATNFHRVQEVVLVRLTAYRMCPFAWETVETLIECIIGIDMIWHHVRSAQCRRQREFAHVR
jgi:hypothetical protein